MPENSIIQLARLNPGAEPWLDSSPLIYPKWKEGFLSSVTDPAKKKYWEGELARLYNEASPADSVLVGTTTNPPLSLQVVKEQPEKYRAKAEAVKALGSRLTVPQRFYLFYSDIVRDGADMFLPVFERTKGKLGYISGQVDPRDSTHLKAMVEMGVALNRLRPNIMIKMPGTREGIYGIQLLTAMGIPTNATLTFSLSQLIAVAEAVKKGLQQARENRVDLSAWKSVVTMMLGRMEDAKDFTAELKQSGISLTESELRWAGIAVFKKAYRIFKERNYESKMLAASMRLGPTLDGVQKIWHVEKLSGAAVVLTIFPNILEAFLKNYDGQTLTSNIDEPVPAAVLEKLLKTKYFRQAYEEDGLKSDEYIDFGPVRETAEVFNKATDEMEAYIR